MSPVYSNELKKIRESRERGASRWCIETVLLSSAWPMCHIRMSEKLVMAGTVNDGFGDKRDGFR